MKKILFHGNCQSGVVAKLFQRYFSNKYQVIHCKEAGLSSFWGQSPAFSMWSPCNKRALKDKQVRLNVQKKVKEADIFVFMHQINTHDEINSINLHDNFARGLKICLSNSRFGVYPICNVSLSPYIKYVQQNITCNKTQIVEYIKHEDDPMFTNILYDQYPFRECRVEDICQNTLKAQECMELYENFLPMNSFIEKNWRNSLLFCTFNHPTELYYREMLYQLLNFLGEDLSVLENIKEIKYPKGQNDTVINVNEFLFFEKNIPDLSIPEDLELKSLDAKFLRS